jgi:hypothetical protein
MLEFSWTALTAKVVSYTTEQMVLIVEMLYKCKEIVQNILMYVSSLRNFVKDLVQQFEEFGSG